jgi:hypothetical protein
MRCDCVNDIQYRMATTDDMPAVAEFLVSHGITLPNVALMVPVFWIAVEGSEIVDLCMMQAVPVVELAGRSGDTIFQLLLRAEQFIRETRPSRVLMHSSHRSMKKMLEHKGARESTDSWYEWNGGR